MAHTRTINNEVCTQIGKGEFCTAYRSNDNSDTVYLVCVEGDYVKEILTQIQNTPHIPFMQQVDEYESRGTSYTIWKTTYSNKLTAAHKDAWKITRILRETWENTPFTKPCPYFGTRRQNQEYIDAWHERCYNFIETLREQKSVPESIIDALDSIYNWATAYGSNFLFEFQTRNLGVDNDGNLILRDIIFFRTYNDLFGRE